MNFRAPAFALFALLAVATGFAQPAPAAAQVERAGAAFVLARGRAPTAAELQRWLPSDESSVGALLTRHRGQLPNDAAATREVAARAAEDAFGRSAVDDAAAPAGALYFEQLQQRVQQLAHDPAAYAEVIQRAYQRTLRRNPYDIELGYWRARPVLSYAVLVGCIENWALRNAPGLMATTGAPTISVNSNYLTTVRLSPAVATEARAAAGLGEPRDADRFAATGRTVVAPGAADVISVGHIHAAVCGGPTIVLADGAR